MRESIFKIIFVLTLSFCVLQAATAAIMDAEERRQKIDTVSDLVSVGVDPLDAVALNAALNPFVPDTGSTVELVEEEEVVLSDDELLAALSEYINPTGIFLFGGEFYLVFKEKKLKVGSEIEIIYNNTEYTVIVTRITGSNYTVRRGNAELLMKLK